MQEFVPGQRWICDSELDMGLATVLACEPRTVTLLFLSTGETRTYARQSAPLTRVRFSVGDTINAHQGWTLKVERVIEQDGLLSYLGRRDDGSEAELEEGQLDNFIQLNQAGERLFNGQIDADKWFELRYQTLSHRNRLAHSELFGLTGSRTSLIPHQLYIAHEVANRYAPRVLLADEVGLGKTIEAGLILHHQLLTERAQRVLIIVPETLTHQWLVEMLRRFNRHFSLFDESRCQSMDHDETHNPFESEQLILCSLNFLRDHPGRFSQCLAADWDLLIVDEAHHLQWSEQQPSDEYRLIETLAKQIRGVLLLTATPEQLGKASHFARLRLLDPDRFNSYQGFINEEIHYQAIAQAVDQLLSEQLPDKAAKHALLNALTEHDNQHLFDTLQEPSSSATDRVNARNTLIENLLDRHGTGRVLFRNTRAAVKGFPKRELIPYPLPLPEPYRQWAETNQDLNPRLLLCPELGYQACAGDDAPHWHVFDPRIPWLEHLLKQFRPAKVLLITASAQTTVDLAETLKQRYGIHAAVFHEHMSLVERDRAAAYFADLEKGTQILICSEIGSEGRNFQFAHHLVLFDLPLNPDLLEQRIGRLDRIGQSETIRIHVPYLEDSAQEIIYRWYHQGLNAFEQTCPAGHSVFVQKQSDLIEALQHGGDKPDAQQRLIDQSHEIHQLLNESLQKGRDRLLEYNSCRPSIAEDLKQRAEIEDQHSDLGEYMDTLFDCFGVDTEIHSAASLVAYPSAHMISPLPGLDEDGMTLTYDRMAALANEDMQFITWEHPLVLSAMDAVLSHEQGNTAVTAIKQPGLKPGTLLLECIYVLESASSHDLQSSRYLPPTTLRIVIDQHLSSHCDRLVHEAINQSLIPVDSDTAGKIVRSQKQQLKSMLTASEKIAHERTPAIINLAHADTRQTLEQEISRLKALALVNPNIRDEEIQFFARQQQSLLNALASANPRLDAIRVIVAT